jgi:alanine-glyoxylate transaminase/serine-glyoxylate transaminase/serine-pyruvate transaminase
VTGLERLGLGLLVAEEWRLPQLNSVIVPDGLDESGIRRRLLDGHGIEVGAGLGDLAGKVLRIGLMGRSATEGNVNACLAALEGVLQSGAWEYD